MARTYKRDSRGRFAGGGGGGSSRGGGRKPLQRGTNRLTRDNAGRITSVGGDGATARGGRLRTASGKQRATVTARGIGRAPAGTVGRSGGRAKAAKQSEATVMSGTSRVPAAQRPGSMTSTLRSTLRSLAQADARRIREIEAITGQPVRAPRRAPAGQGATVRAPGRRSVSGTLRDNLRALAQSDARTMRGMADLTKPAPAGAIKGGTSRKALKASAKALPAAKPAAAAKPASKRRTLPASARPASTTPKPRGLEQMAVTNRIMNREQAAARSATARIERAQMRNRRLNTMQREIDYRRANPVGGRAARGQATKRLNKAQRKLDQSRGKVFSAIEVNYKPSRKRAEDRLAQLTRAVRSTAGLRAGRRGARYQRSLFGGATVAYNR